MDLLPFVRQRRWASLSGYLFFIGMMATGYYYNLTFVQFGLLDLGTRLVGMSEASVARSMALLALITSITAIGAGLGMMRLGWSRSLPIKLRLGFGVVLAQTLLTAGVGLVRTESAFVAWIVAASLALGIGVPAMFSMTVDLVPVRLRGMAGAWITAAAYFFANVLNFHWTIEWYQSLTLGIMAAGTLGMGVLAFVPLRITRQLAQQQQLPEYGRGRFVRPLADGKNTVRRSLWVLFFLMFGIYFIDSLGFLRLAHTPFFFETAWQSPELGPRLLIAVTHVVAALAAGVLYAALHEKELFLWVFGIFALVHLMYTLAIRSDATGGAALAQPFLYAIAVSLYTVINFAVWADISTPATVSRNTAVGVALSGWTATFASTALALQMRLQGVSLEMHLRIVDALAILFFLLVVGLLFFAPANSSNREPGEGGSR